MNNLFNLAVTPDSLPLMVVILNILLAFILSLGIAITYRNTHKGLSYSQSFTFTLILIGTLIAVIMMVIGGSLARAFGAFGAFSLVRFRTAIKDSKDIAFILLAVAIGLAVGTSNYTVAVFATLFSITVIYVLTKINFGSIRKYDYVINFSGTTGQFSNEKLREIFKEFLSYDNLLNVIARENGKVLDYSFNVKFLKLADSNKFIEKLSQLEGVENVELISAKNDIEY